MEHTHIRTILFEASSTRGNTALHDYVLNHEFDPHIMKSLIVNRAYLNLRNDTRKTAFLLAVVHRQKEMIKFLIENKTRVNVKDHMGNTALHYIALHELNDYFECDGPGCDRTRKNRFHFDNQYTILKILLNAGVNVNSRNNRGETPLMWAARGKHLEIVKLLLEFGADVHARNYCRQTCLHVALNYGDSGDPLYIREWNDVNFAIVLELVRNEACVNCFDKIGRPALEFVLQILPGLNVIFAKKLTKEAALVNWRKKVDFYLDNQRILGQPPVQVHSLVKYYDDCYDEIYRMRGHEFPRGSNLCLFARGGVSEDEKNHEFEINEKVLEILLRETFPIYHDVILVNLKTSFLRRIASEKGFHTIREKRDIKQKIDLRYDDISQISSYLEIRDLFNLIFAFHQKVGLRKKLNSKH